MEYTIAFADLAKLSHPQENAKADRDGQCYTSIAIANLFKIAHLKRQVSNQCFSSFLRQYMNPDMQSVN